MFILHLELLQWQWTATATTTTHHLNLHNKHRLKTQLHLEFWYVNFFCIVRLCVRNCIVLPKFSPEPKFEPELWRTRPKFSPRFRCAAELNLRFDSAFKQTVFLLNVFELGLNWTSASCLVCRTMPADFFFFFFFLFYFFENDTMFLHGKWPHWLHQGPTTDIIIDFLFFFESPDLIELLSPCIQLEQ